MGALGMERLASWHDSARFALAFMFVLTGVAHFTKMKHDMAAMVPRAFPQPMLMVYFTGLCELLGAIGLLIPTTREAAGLALIVMLVAVFPANVKAAGDGLTLRGKPATPLWLRAPGGRNQCAG
jgi:uncharacterized membrane protein